ncbi:hypothetical protein Psp6_00001 [Pseudomonas phage Psp6]|nr:hypothetical protein Psp6_00001 [Pseudomonas phage Psp6]
MTNVYDTSLYPLGSTKPKVVYNNVSNMDEAMNSLTSPWWTDRFGRQRLTWFGMEYEWGNFLQNMGFEPVHLVYVDGSPLVVSRPTQLIDRAGNSYKIKQPATFPVTLTGTWATDLTKLTQVADTSLRTELGTGFRQKLDGSWYMPNDLDLTGVVDESAKVLGYLNTFKRVRLPAGVIKLNIVVPSGCSLTGAGRTKMNRVTKAWVAGGTTILGTIGLTGSKGCTVTNLNIDAYATGVSALAGVSDTTEDHYIAYVNTRSNDHGQLWEQNGSDPGGANGGNIYVTDCDHYDGPNGFVTKMRDVTFVRCFAYDVTVQGHVAVSDNINGPAIYSRAQRTRFIDCGGDGCNIGLSIYSRDAHSASNANGVSGTLDTYWSGTHTNVTAGFIHTGFFLPIDPGTTALFNDQVTIDGGSYFNAPIFGIRFDHAARPRVLRGHFQNCANPIVQGTNCVDLVVEPAVSCFGTINPGILSAYIVESTNAVAINVDIVRELLIFQNTVPTTVATLVTSARVKKMRVLIDDNVTTLAIGGRAMSGKGSVIDLHWSDVIGAWTVGIAGSQLPDSEVPFAYALSLSLFWRSKAASVTMSGNINLLDVSGANVPPGTHVTLRLAASGNFSVFAWSGVTWGTITPVGAITVGQTVLITMYYTGSTFVVTGVNKY